MSNKLSIRRLLYLVLMVLLIPPSLLLAYSIYSSYREEINSIHLRSLTLARNSSDDAVSLVKEARYILDNLLGRPLIRALDSNRCDPILHDLMRWHREFANLSTMDRSGQVICNSSSRPGQVLPNYGHREWFGRVAATGSFVIG